MSENSLPMLNGIFKIAFIFSPLHMLNESHDLLQI